MKKFITLIFCSLIVFSFCGCEQQTTSNQQQESNKDTTTKKIEPNTSSMVDALVLKGKEKTKTATESELNESLNYIKTNIDNCFSSNEIMENFIYYGSILEYYYNGGKKGSDIKGEIGMDAVQLVKYVYRNVETPNDEATISNLKQIKENLARLQ